MTPVPSELIRPHPDRLHPQTPRYGAIIEAHDEAVRAGRSRYLDPATGLWVMTAKFLWDRGYCCDSGCRHCPYVDRAGRAPAGR